MTEIVTKIIIGWIVGGIYCGLWFHINYLMPNISGKKHAALQLKQILHNIPFYTYIC